MPETEAMLTIAPFPWRTICGSALLAHQEHPIQVYILTLSQLPSLVSTGPPTSKGLWWEDRGGSIRTIGAGCKLPSGYLSPASDRPFREPLDVANRSHPRQRVVAKYLARWRHRFRVVQGTDMNDHQAWPGSRLLGNRRAAFRAEMSKHRLPAAAEASERLSRALDGQRLLRHIHQSAECAAGESLAVSTVAHGRRQRFRGCRVAYRSAQTTTLQLRHHFLPQLGSFP